MSDCRKCRFSLLLDNGYSNWTVMGTEFHCRLGKHPDDGFDIFYGVDDPRYEFAGQCDSFVEGKGIHIDVDQEEVASLGAEDKALWDGWNS